MHDKFKNEKIFLKSLVKKQKENYQSVIGHFTIEDDKKNISLFKPELRIYDQPIVVTSEADIKTTLFSDIKIETSFRFYDKALNSILLSKASYDKFKLLGFFKPKATYSSNLKLTSATTCTSLSLLDIRGEILLKNLFLSLDSSVGRAKD